MIHIAFTARIAAVIALLFTLASCGDSGPQAPPGPQVTVAKPVKREVVDMDEYVGRFLAVDMVEMRARVYLDQIHFKDGQIVQAGDLLFTIDRRPFQNTLDQAKGTLAQARANLAFTESDLARAQRLVTDKTISEQAFEQRTQSKRNAEASVASNEAAVRQAELDLQFTELRAPVTGRIGDRRVAPGNLVTGGTAGNTTLLATIVSIDPIRFEFSADEGAFIRYERLAKSGNDPESRFTSTPVELKLLDEQDFPHKGTIDFVVSDHSPCPPEMKLRETGDFMNAWGGISSLQLRLPIIWTEGRARGFTIDRIAEWLCAAPARQVGLGHLKGSIKPGADADIVIWNPDAEIHVTSEMIQHRHKLTPYAGETLSGVVEKTFLRGRMVYDGGEFVSGPQGQVIFRNKN